MMSGPMFDMESAAVRLESVVGGITDDRLDDPTPCAELSVGDLLAHVVGLRRGVPAGCDQGVRGTFPTSGPPEVGPGAALVSDWRTDIPAHLTALVAAWREPCAWEGQTEAGGVVAPASELAVIALDEIVIHAWDLAAATGQSYTPDDADVAVLMRMVGETPPEGVAGLFGPTVPVPDEAPLWDRVLGLTGRDPAWSADRAR